MTEADQSGGEAATVVSGVMARLVVEGEVDVVIGDPAIGDPAIGDPASGAPARTVRVLVPAGVGLPGVTDEELAAGLVAELRDRDRPIPEVLDVSAVLGSDPRLLDAVSDRLDAQG